MEQVGYWIANKKLKFEANNSFCKELFPPNFMNFKKVIF